MKHQPFKIEDIHNAYMDYILRGETALPQKILFYGTYYTFNPETRKYEEDE